MKTYLDTNRSSGPGWHYRGDQLVWSGWATVRIDAPAARLEAAPIGETVCPDIDGGRIRLVRFGSFALCPLLAEQRRGEFTHVATLYPDRGLTGTLNAIGAVLVGDPESIGDITRQIASALAHLDGGDE